MPKAKTQTKTAGPQCSCGPLTPQPADQEIGFGTQPQEVLAKIMLLCDDKTGVLFFRDSQKLYLRVVTTQS